MSKLDRLIEESLAEEDRALFAKFGEQGLFAGVGELFTGRLGFVNAISAVAQIALFAGALFAGQKFLVAGDVPEMLRWGALFGGLFLAMSVIKLMHWMQFQANRVLREVKRVELQIARARTV